MKKPHSIKIIHITLIAAFVISFVYIPRSQAIELPFSGEIALPSPGSMVNLSPAFTPAIVRGMTIDVKNPFAFTFLIDRGDSPMVQERKKLIIN